MIELSKESAQMVSGGGILDAIGGAVIGWAISKALDAATPSAESAISNASATLGANMIASSPIAGTGY